MNAPREDQKGCMPLPAVEAKLISWLVDGSAVHTARTLFLTFTVQVTDQSTLDDSYFCHSVLQRELRTYIPIYSILTMPGLLRVFLKPSNQRHSWSPVPHDKPINPSPNQSNDPSRIFS